MDIVCHRCDQKGQLKKMCRTLEKYITEEQKEFLGIIQVDIADSTTATSPWTAAIKINNRESCQFKVDTGVDINVTVMPTKEYDFIKDGLLVPSN